MKIGLFFGSFNPIHSGHLILAHTIMEETDINKVWFVVSPQNPFKDKASLLHEFDRYDLVAAAVSKDTRFEASDVEFRLPKPSYTVDTLAYLREKSPRDTFSLIMGEDNLASFHKWKNYQVLLDQCEILFYPRKTSREIKYEFLFSNKITKVEAAVLDISSTYIRKKIKQKKSVKYLVPSAVQKMIEEKGFYL
jgi:nicotinate-nucleotide adenylyltransferase